MDIEHVLPQDIEKRSMQIIEEELGEVRLDPDKKDIIKRVIHTSADFEYAHKLRFSDNAVESALNAIRHGCTILTDTNMACTGINAGALKQTGSEKICYMADDEVAAKGDAERGCAGHPEVIQDRVRRVLPLGLEGHARCRRVPLAGTVEGDDVEGTVREVGREVDDLLRVAVESVHHDECVRRARRGLRAVNRFRLPPHRGELPTAIGDRVPGEREAFVGLVEGG